MLVSASQDGTAVAWETEAGKQITRFTGHTGALCCVAVTSDGGKAVTGSRDCSLLMWSTETGNIEMPLSGHTDWCYDCQITPDDTMLVSASADKTLRVWDLETGKTVQVLVGHSGAVLCCAVTDDGSRIVSGSRDSTARVWDSVTGNTLLKLRDHSDWVLSCCFVDDTTVATGSADRSILLWDIDTGKEKHKLQGHHNWVNSLTPIDDGNKLISISEDKRLCKWDVKTGQCDHVIAAHTVWRSAASASTKLLTSGKQVPPSVVALGLLEGRFSKDTILCVPPELRVRSLNRLDQYRPSELAELLARPTAASSFTFGRQVRSSEPDYSTLARNSSRLSKTIPAKLPDGDYNRVYASTHSSKGSTSPPGSASWSGGSSPPAPMTPRRVSQTSSRSDSMWTVHVRAGTDSKRSIRSMDSSVNSINEDYSGETQKTRKFGCIPF